MKRIVILVSILVFSSFFLINCSNNKKKDDHSTERTQEEAVVKDKKDCSDVHWSHHPGEEGPENWKNLCDGFLSCGGQAQSPIDIETHGAEESDRLAAIELDYETSQVEIINNGHTVQFNVSGENSVILDGKKYELLQFHYHAKSEHKIDGKQFPIEVHFVNKHSDNDYAVLGIMFKEGGSNNLFADYLNRFPTHEGKFEGDGVLELSKLLPSNLSYYYYKGSLTTPPCSEVVNWYVLKAPLEASGEQIEKFSEILHDNFRPVMPLNGREVFSYSN